MVCQKSGILKYTLNFVAHKIIVGDGVKLPNDIKLIRINDYLRKWKNEPFCCLFLL